MSRLKLSFPVEAWSVPKALRRLIATEADNLMFIDRGSTVGFKVLASHALEEAKCAACAWVFLMRNVSGGPPVTENLHFQTENAPPAWRPACHGGRVREGTPWRSPVPLRLSSPEAVQNRARLHASSLVSLIASGLREGGIDQKYHAMVHGDALQVEFPF